MLNRPAAKRSKTLSKAAFARLCGVTPGAVSIALRAQRVFADEHGQIPVAHPTNREYIVAQRAKRGEDTPPRKPSSRASSGKKRSEGHGSAVGLASVGPEDDQGLPLIVRRLMADIRLKTKQADVHELRAAEKRGKLIPRELVGKWFSSLNADLKIHFLELPRRVVPRLVAMIEDGKKAEAQAYLEGEITDALARVLGGCDDRAREYFDTFAN